MPPLTSTYQGIPVFSERDDPLRSEGSIDPLGLYPIADRLGLELAPGVRERQSRPRFLTVIAVSHCLCQHFGSDHLASDGKSPPWQVFEWHVVEGLVRIIGNTGIRGLAWDFLLFLWPDYHMGSDNICLTG